MNTHTVELLSLGNANEIVVSEGITATYDVANGDLRLGRIINNGTIRLLSADADAEVAIIVDEVVNGGLIESEANSLKLVTPKIDARSGKFKAATRIVIESDCDVEIASGSFAAEHLFVKASGMAKIHAYRIDAMVDVCAKGIALGVRTGNLNIVRQKIDGDPLYYCGAEEDGGDLSFTPDPTDGEDLTAVAVGNITIGGDIDTTGGDETNFGRVILIAGCDEVKWGDLENSGIVQCNDCRPYQSIEIPQLTFILSEIPAGVVTVNGNIDGQQLQIRAGDVTIDGDINIVSVTNEEGGSADISASGDVSITGTVNCNHDAFVEDGGAFGVFGAATVSVAGDITAGVEIITAGEGSVSVANAEGISIRIYAGDPMSIIPYCGGGGFRQQTRGRSFQPGAKKSLLGDPSTITAGNLTAKGSVYLYATSDIGVGNIDLQEWIPTTSTHDVRIYANIGQETADPFDLGGGGSNGSGTISVDGVSNFGGAIAIGNVGGITVAVADMIATPNDIGTPNIILDGGQGPVELDGDIITDGDSDIRAGQIVITGSGLVISGALTLSANDSTTSSFWPAPLIALALSDNPLSGNLNIHCNSDQGTKVLFGPTGSISVNWKDETNAVAMCNFNPTDEAVSFTGSGNIEITANSNFGEVQIYGNPLTFDVGTVDVKSLGDSTQVQISYAGEPADPATLVSTGGAVTLDSHNPDGNGGSVNINAGGVNITSDFLAKADADTNGYGGFVGIAALGDVTVEGGAGSFELSADGAGSGNAGGTVNVSGANVTADADHISVTPGTDGNGGQISLNATEDLTPTGDFNASGDGSGSGGSLNAYAQGTLDVSTATFTAEAGGTAGNGGFITLSSGDTLAVDAGDLSVLAGTDGYGGFINISSMADLTLTGDFDASGDGDGDGGFISVVAGTTLDLSTASLTADGGDTANGGALYISSGDALSVDSEILSVLAGTDGNGGSISISSSDDLTATGNFDASGDGDGNGGFLTLSAGATLDISAATMTADAGGSAGNGGTISISAENALALEAETISVLAGTDGDGGTINIVSGSDFTATGTFNVDGDGTGQGGRLEFSAEGEFELSDATLTANGDTSGNGGSINLSAGAFMDLGSATVRCTANDGQGGTVEIHGAGDVLLGDIDASAAGAGQGGTITLVSDQTITIEDTSLSLDSHTIAAKGGSGDGQGGFVTFTATGLIISGTLDVSGQGDASGGDLTITSSGDLDISQASLKANGGTSGNGGTISVQLADDTDATHLAIKDMSATAGDGKSGGQITIQNQTASAFNIDITGALRTQAGFSLSGLTTVIPSSGNDDVYLRVYSGGGFNSYLVCEANNVTFQADDVVQLGIVEVRAAEDVLITMPTNTAAFVNLRDEEAIIEADREVEIHTSALINNQGTIRGLSVDVNGLNDDLVVTSSGTLQSFASTGGRNNVILQTVGVLTLNGSGTLDGARVLVSGSDLNISASQVLRADDSTEDPAVVFGGDLTSVMAVDSNVTVTVSPAAEQSGEGLTLFVQYDLIHNAGSIVNTSESGIISFGASSNGAISGDGNGLLDATNLRIDGPQAVSFSQGEVAATHSAISGPILSGDSHGDWHFAAANGDLFPVSIGALSAGDVSVTATSGTVNVGDGVIQTSDGSVSIVAGEKFVLAAGSITADGGNVAITIGALGTPNNNTVPSGVTIAPSTSAGQVYWGVDSVQVHGTNNVVNITGGATVVFDTNGTGQSAIELGDNAIVSAG